MTTMCLFMRFSLIELVSHNNSPVWAGLSADVGGTDATIHSD
jgi:hypothetical protein